MLVVVVEHFLRERLEHYGSGGLCWHESTGAIKGVLTYPAVMYCVPIVFEGNTPGVSLRNKPDDVPLMPRCAVAVCTQRIRLGKENTGIWVALHRAIRMRLVEFVLMRPP